MKRRMQRLVCLLGVCGCLVLSMGSVDVGHSHGAGAQGGV